MSFSYNPYQHIELLQSDVFKHLWYWHCDSCGADSNRSKYIGELPLSQAEDLRKDFFDHLRNSHGRTPEDFAGWSKE